MTIVRTFDTGSSRPGLLQHLRGLIGLPQLVWQNRYMVQNFFQRDLRARFHGSMLGAWWMLVQPMFMFCVYFLIFGVLYSRDDAPPSIEFALYLFNGVVCFHALTEATSTSCGIVISNGNLVKKVAFPSEVLPLPPAMVSIVVYLVGAALTLVIGAATGTRFPGIEMLLLPLVLVAQFVFTLGIGMLLANANVFVRDVQQLWRIFSASWFFLSPVFWKPDMMIDAIGEDWANVLFHVNPAYSLLSAHRIVLGGEVPGYGLVDIWHHLGVISLWAVAALVVGYVTFVANKHKHSDIV